MAAVLERPEVVLFLVLLVAGLLGRARRHGVLIRGSVGVVLQLARATGTDDHVVVTASVAGEALACRGRRDMVRFGSGSAMLAGQAPSSSIGIGFSVF